MGTLTFSRLSLHGGKLLTLSGKRRRGRGKGRAEAVAWAGEGGWRGREGEEECLGSVGSGRKAKGGNGRGKAEVRGTVRVVCVTRLDAVTVRIGSGALSLGLNGAT